MAHQVSNNCCFQIEHYSIHYFISVDPILQCHQISLLMWAFFKSGIKKAGGNAIYINLWNMKFKKRRRNKWRGRTTLHCSETYHITFATRSIRSLHKSMSILPYQSCNVLYSFILENEWGGLSPGYSESWLCAWFRSSRHHLNCTFGT